MINIISREGIREFFHMWGTLPVKYRIQTPEGVGLLVATAAFTWQDKGATPEAFTLAAARALYLTRELDDLDPAIEHVAKALRHEMQKAPASMPGPRKRRASGRR